MRAPPVVDHRDEIDIIVVCLSDPGYHNGLTVQDRQARLLSSALGYLDRAPVHIPTLTVSLTIDIRMLDGMQLGSYHQLISYALHRSCLTAAQQPDDLCDRRRC